MRVRLRVAPDLVLADECGVCFVPAGRAAEVLAIAQRWSTWEDERLKKLASGMPLDEFTKMTRPQ